VLALMPYITKDAREDLAAGRLPRTPGELNFAITKLLNAYVRSNYGRLSYQLINDALGAVEGAKLEFYRRVVVDFENGKLAENGDCYGAVASAPSAPVEGASSDLPPKA
jgi:hypothetical protein